MSFSRFRSFLQGKHGKTIGYYVVGMGGMFTIFYSLQDLRYEKSRIKSMSPEKASKLLEENRMIEHKKKMEEEQELMKSRVQDNYNMVPIDKLELKDLSLLKEANKKNSQDNVISQLFSKATSLRANVEILMEGTRKRLKGNPSESMKYKILQEHKALFEEHYIDSQILLKDVQQNLKNLDKNVEKEYLDLGKEIESDVKSLVELVNKNLEDIDQLLERMTKLGKS